ncbi:putative amino acid permease [Klebsiella pneumoniae]|uniref:Putative amino acid permease n=1 Tax=Klebsiella pneumoniae TaxID=573 RepID=A0A378AJP3_KLEPN|nr:putative amino acid permease [Klebsiella pneumoniae]
MVWLMILLSHFAMRRGLSAEERSQIAFPIPFWPVAPLLTLLFMGLVIAVLGMFAENADGADRRPGLARAADGGVVCAGA